MFSDSATSTLAAYVLKRENTIIESLRFQKTNKQTKKTLLRSSRPAVNPSLLCPLRSEHIKDKPVGWPLYGLSSIIYPTLESVYEIIKVRG